MDAKILRVIEEQMRCWPAVKGLDAFMKECSQSGIFWLTDEHPPWMREMDFDELEIRSALEFLRPELTARQIGYLEAWTAVWQTLREDGTFHRRVKEVLGGRLSWPAYRKEVEEALGRPIPRSHWWFWPPEDKSGRPESREALVD